MIKIYEYSEYKEKVEDIFKSEVKRDSKITSTVNQIFEDILNGGDEALFSYTAKFDKVKLNKNNVKINKEDIDRAYERTDDSLIDIMKKAAKNITEFHEKQKEKDYYFTKGEKILLGQKITPIAKVGVYVPGGSAPLLSTVLMNVIPAKIAKVKEIIMVTPPKENGVSDALLAAAKIAGVDQIYQIGGAQAICALAIGTKSIPKVDKIVGPGNIYVATAKRQVFGLCDIDMIAGPSEICIVADETANEKFVAADMLSQAEHDPLSSSVLITNDRNLATKVIDELKKQTEKLQRKEIAKRAIEDNGKIVLVNNIKEAQIVADEMAPEHLELMIKNASEYKDQFTNAGAIFLGEYSPEALGDYFAGSNHVLPTSKTAKFSSPLGVYDFIKRTSVIEYSKNEFLKIAKDIEEFALNEGLDAHAKSAKVRREGEL